MRVLTIRETAWLNASPGTVWRIVLSLEEWPEWNAVVDMARWRGTRGWKEGHRFSVRYPTAWPLLAGRRREARVSLVEPHEELRWRERFLTFKVEFALAVVPDAEGSLAHFSSHFQGLAARLASGEAVTRRFASFQREFLDSLRAAGERVVGSTP